MHQSKQDACLHESTSVSQEPADLPPEVNRYECCVNVTHIQPGLVKHNSKTNSVFLSEELKRPSVSEVYTMSEQVGTAHPSRLQEAKN